MNRSDPMNVCLFVLSALPPQTVSYARFLLPTNALVRQKNSSAPDAITAQTPKSCNRNSVQKGFTPARLNSTADAGMAAQPFNQGLRHLLSICQCVLFRKDKSLLANCVTHLNSSVLSSTGMCLYKGLCDFISS